MTAAASDLLALAKPRITALVVFTTAIGLWLAPRGYLAFKSGLFPRAVGVVLVVATVSYLLDVLAAFSSPDLAKAIHPFLIIAPAIGEVWMVVYLLVWGVRTPHVTGRGPIAP